MRPNLLDRAIGVIAPRTGLKRLKARAAFEAITRSFAGAATGRHTDGWKASSTSADSEVASAGSRLRDRHRDLVRNNPIATNSVCKWATALVGDGIMPRTTNKKAMDLFKTWSRKCDADGQLDFYGLQYLAVHEMVEGGEVIVRRRRRRLADKLPAPVQVQVLEADFIDSSRNGPVGAAGSNVIVQGIEFNPLGSRDAYWLFGEHPGNVAVTFMARRLASAPIAASDCIHLYEKTRTQVRGVPWGHSIIRKARDLDDYDFAEGIRKKIEAAYVGAVVCDDDGETGVTGSPKTLVTDASGNPIEQFEPGLFAFIRGGKDIKFNAPAAVAGYEDYDRVSSRKIAAGYRIPYEVATGDLSNVNYSSIRAGLVEWRRLVRHIQWSVIIPTLCQPMWDWFCEAAFLAGEIDSPDVPVEWDTPRFEWVDPYKDGLADIQAIRAGIKTWQEAVAERGRNPAEVLAEIKAFNKMMDDEGIVLDIDPRKTSRAGLTQARPAGTQLPSPEVPGEGEPAEPSDDDERSARALLRIVRRAGLRLAAVEGRTL